MTQRSRDQRARPGATPTAARAWSAARSPAFLFLAGATVFWTLYAVWLALRLGGDTGLQYLSDVVYELPPAVGTATLALAALRARGRARVGWALAAAGMAAWAAGEWAFASYDLFLHAETPVPSIADLLYYLGYAGMMAALVVLVGLVAGPRANKRGLLDALIVGLALTVFSWRWVLAPVVRASDIGSIGLAATLGYPLMDLAMVVVVVVALYRSNWRLPAPLLFLALGALMNGVSDSLFLNLTVAHGYDATGNPVEMGWVISYTLSAFAGVLQWRRQALPAAEGAVEPWGRESRLGVSLPYLLALPLLVLVVDGIATGSASPVVAAGAALVLCLVVLRQWWNLTDAVATARAKEKERRRAADALREREARLAGILDTASEAIISIDGGQRIIMFNRGAQRIFGYSADEALGQPADILIPERYRASHRRQVAEFGASTATAASIREGREIRGLRKNGDEFYAEASISKLETDAGKVYTVVLRDVTERKQA
ncbi:MAG TPA: PAS domain S-box protein, partial [Dehalococcoidia bacterium]|nr:PAS domain S-box protein [Dehalococcoidia bacterium]